LGCLDIRTPGRINSRFAKFGGPPGAVLERCGPVRVMQKDWYMKRGSIVLILLRGKLRNADESSERGRTGNSVPVYVGWSKFRASWRAPYLEG